MPALIMDGGRGQAALVSPIGGKIGNPVSKRHDVSFWRFQMSQEAKPVRGRLNEEFSRPPRAVHTLTLLLLASPAIGGSFNGRRSNRVVTRDVDSLGDNQQLLGVPLQGRASQALAGAEVQESFSGFCERTAPDAERRSPDTETEFRTYSDLLWNGGGPTSIHDLVMWHSPKGTPSRHTTSILAAT